jgi:predicted AlkP superfamily pyrophosphatase or phosphodiesterase
MLLPPKIPMVLISIDGLIADYVLNADHYRLAIPHFRRLLAEGSYATRVKGVIPTTTYPSHATLITGVPPAIHGIVNNELFDPFKKHPGIFYWYAKNIKVPTLWDVAQEKGLVTANIDWPVSVGANLDYNIPQCWLKHDFNRTEKGNIKLLRELSSPPNLLDEAQKSIGSLDLSWTVHGDKNRTDLTIFLLKQKRVQFVTVCLTSLDMQQHADGTYTENVFTVLESIDEMLGQIRIAAEQMGDGKAFIFVVSDHGFASIRKSIRLNVAFKKAGLMTVDELGNLVSWRVFAWQADGTTAVMLKNHNDNEAYQKAKVVLETLAADPSNGIAKILDAHKAKELGSFPNAIFVVGAQMDCRFIEDLEGPIITKEEELGGTHGHFPDDSGRMDAAFFAVGPNIVAKQNLGTINLIDVAPTVTAFMGMELPTAKGMNILAGKRVSGTQNKS